MSSTIYLLVIALFVIALLGLFVWFSRRRKPTIAPAHELQALIKAGKAVPVKSRHSPEWPAPLPWSEIKQITDPYQRYLKMGELVTYKAVNEGDATLAPLERLIYQVWVLESEVNNGGFDQYFFNSSGDLALDTLVDLTAIGAEEAHGLLREAVALMFEGAPARQRERRWEQMEAVDETKRAELEGLDTRFFALQEPIYQLVVDYVTSHQAGDDVA
ncbi:MAG: DMP19 family protein [Anaerolineales bacterium]|nr:DMP19 family protein [Anaerolineales bacterium]